MNGRRYALANRVIDNAIQKANATILSGSVEDSADILTLVRSILDKCGIHFTEEEADSIKITGAGTIKFVVMEQKDSLPKIEAVLVKPAYADEVIVDEYCMKHDELKMLRRNSKTDELALACIYCDLENGSNGPKS